MHRMKESKGMPSVTTMARLSRYGLAFMHTSTTTGPVESLFGRCDFSNCSRGVDNRSARWCVMVMCSCLIGVCPFVVQSIVASLESFGLGLCRYHPLSCVRFSFFIPLLEIALVGFAVLSHHMCTNAQADNVYIPRFLGALSLSLSNFFGPMNERTMERTDLTWFALLMVC